MKKLAALIAALVLILSLAACNDAADEDVWDYTQEGSRVPSTGVTLNVYNWGEYIDDELLDVNKAFTYLTGIEVNYQTFDNNESMYALLSSGAADYDVVFPSDYMAGKMISEGMCAKLNFDNIPNYEYIDEQYKNLPYDPNNEYTVPYTWGTVGIFYNSNYVTDEEAQQGWDVLWNEKFKGKILMFDNPRDAFAIALQKLGYSINTVNPDEWQAAFDLLKEQKPLLKQYVNDEIYDLMTEEEAYIAPYYAGDCTIMIYGDSGNEAIKFYIPEDGTNFFVDCMCVRSTTKHQAEAEAYINFLCRTEVAKANAEYIGYSTPHKEARKQLDPEIGENPYFYPSQEIMDKTEMFLTLPEDINKLQSDLWVQLTQ
ncbi:MAG: spermidine/putrescine ABC transporter substrate-binding protein [Clostridia bacterium]|nr:spermidine/putrescine ABC transporter substrate-binding protein [Clostridia bacterium]